MQRQLRPPIRWREDWDGYGGSVSTRTAGVEAGRIEIVERARHARLERAWLGRLSQALVHQPSVRAGW
ncbi:MAG: hypothetical protein AB7P40_16675 [Chloroflexota bacterium]